MLFAVLIGLALAAGLGCERKPRTSAADQAIAGLRWTNQLEHYRSEILTGSWTRAGNCWAKLSNNTNWTEEELGQWMHFQTEVIQFCKTPELRRSAMQQLSFFPDAARPYLGWLKEGLATNLFSDPFIAEKARETVTRLENAPP